MGQELINQALNRGRSVTALVRRPDGLKNIIPLRENSLNIITGDATNSDDVATAIRDADAVVHTVSVPLFHPKPTHLYSSTTQAAITARPQTQAIQYIVMSSSGTHQIRKALPRGVRYAYEYLLGDVADDKEREEILLENSDLPWTVIKSPFLIPGSIKKTTLTPFQHYRPMPWDMISRSTVTSTILDIITHE